MQLALLDVALPERSGVSNSDIIRAYLGLLVQGKSDFDAVEGYRGDKFFKSALGIGLLASSPTLRQRLDAQAAALLQHIPGMNERLLGSQRPDYGVLPCGWLPLDVDNLCDEQRRHRQRRRGPHVRGRERLLPAGGLPGVGGCEPAHKSGCKTAF